MIIGGFLSTYLALRQENTTITEDTDLEQLSQ